ncbi:MAG: hypothetical protein GX362_04925 [Methanosarcinaceae archaeon]|nr:hypothetical protein [Methanosarcinaceae archaeon]
MDDILDENGELANNLADLHEEIMWLEIEKNRDTNPTIDKLKLQMKDLINDAYEKNTLVFIKAPI